MPAKRKPASSKTETQVPVAKALTAGSVTAYGGATGVPGGVGGSGNLSPDQLAAAMQYMSPPIDPAVIAAATRLNLELGAHGTPIFQGIIQEDFNDKFRLLRDALKIYDEMRRTDGTIQAMMLALELPILAADFMIHPFSEEPEDKKIAEFIRWNLMEGMTIPFREVLRQVLTMFWAGFSVFEKVFEVKSYEGENYVTWRKFSMRLQNTVWQWSLDQHGGPNGFIQVAPPLYQRVEIPIEKLLLFTNRKEGGNLQGQSYLRAAYKHWYIKDRLYRLQAIGLERDVVGVPVMKLPPNASNNDKSIAKKIVTTLRRDEAAGVTIPNTWELLLKGLNGSPTSGQSEFMKTILHHDLQCAKSILAQFLNLGGGGGSGSYALSVEQTNLMTLAEEAATNYITEVFNLHAIHQLVDLNWPGYGKYPRLEAGKISRQDIRTAAANLGLLARSGLIQVDGSILNYIRRQFGLPEQFDPEVPGETDDLSAADISAANLNLTTPVSPVHVTETEDITPGGGKAPPKKARGGGAPANTPSSQSGGGTGSAKGDKGVYSVARSGKMK